MRRLTEIQLKSNTAKYQIYKTKDTFLGYYKIQIICKFRISKYNEQVKMETNATN